ncbi:hypothetical protein K438DRAFT_1983419 [Mycena galopus ATCC 62051]|nr:hypothetical protein K438DRAFT_1983419 [Mycena galopus ATCC 62051]
MVGAAVEWKRWRAGTKRDAAAIMRLLLITNHHHALWKDDKTHLTSGLLLASRCTDDFGDHLDRVLRLKKRWNGIGAPARFVIERDAGVPSDEVDRPHHRDRLESLVALLLLSFPLVRPLPLPPWSPHRSLRPTYRNLGVVDARPQAEREFALMGLLLCIRGNHVPPRRLPLDEDDVAFVFEDTLTLLLLVSFLSSPGSRSLFLVPSLRSLADIPQPNLSGCLLPP